MSTYLPTLLISIAAIAGLVVKHWKFPLFRRWHDETAAIGGYAGGLLFVWSIACLVRGAIAFQFAPSAGWPFFITGLIPLFFAESVLLLILAARQFMQLGGHYEADSEWALSFSDGKRHAVRFVVLASVLFVPALWMLQPGEYGVFKGSIVDGLVVGSIDDAFEPSKAIVDLNSVQSIQNWAAIPHAFALAVLLVVLVYPIKPLYRFMRDELSRDVVHVPKPRRESAPSPLRIFNPRGGGRN